MECPHCKKLIPEEAQICPFCLFVIRDWREGKETINDQGEFIPSYVSDHKTSDLSDQSGGQKSTADNFDTFEHKEVNKITQNSSLIDLTDSNHSEFSDRRNEKNNSQNLEFNYDLRHVDSNEQFEDPSCQEYQSVNQKGGEDLDSISHNLKDNYSNNEPSDDITNVSFQEESKSKKGGVFAKIIVVLFLILILILGAVLVIHFWFRVSLGGKSFREGDLDGTKVTFASNVHKKTALNSPKELTIKIKGDYKKSIPMKNLIVLADGVPVTFETDDKSVKLNNKQTEVTGEIKGLKKFINKFSLLIVSDQKKNLFRSSETKITFPFDLAGTYWQVKYKSDVSSPQKKLSIYFQSNKKYEETLATAPVNYADTKKIKKWNTSQVRGTLLQGQATDGSIRYLTSPQSFVESQYFSNFKHGKDPITRLKYSNGQVPDDLNDYRHEIRLKNNRLYFFLLSANEQVQTQIFLFEEIDSKKFIQFEKTESLPEIRQPGLTANNQVAADIRRRILQNFQGQLSYDLPDNNQAHLNTIFYDSPNGFETTGLITYFSEGKDNNLMKFILYRNGRINVYPLNSGFDVPKAYTINIYHDLKNDDYKKFPDFKK